MMKNMKAGFTLAEVLTTLMVIGVVAAMTIPTLMNSTNDQQYKVAFKKAMSVLSQGTQLMVAKEEECDTAITSSATLAQCMKKVLTGDLVSFNGQNNTTDATKNYVIKTPDGLAYAFYYRGANNSTATSIDEACGSIDTIDTSAGSTSANKYNGTNANCIVVVDVNGLDKGTKCVGVAGGSGSNSTCTEATVSAGSNTQAFSGPTLGNDQAALILTSEGLRPLYATGFDKGYKWMYGDTSPISGS